MATADVDESQELGASRDPVTKDSPGATMADGDSSEKMLEFNLSDPEQLMRQLESVDLTEEEEDKLLSEAYKVNKKLKEILKHQEAQAKAALRSQSADSHASYKPKHSVLPPIPRGSHGPSAKPSRGPSQSYNTSASPLKPSKPRNKSAKSRTPTQQKERPAWDDRFSYS